MSSQLKSQIDILTEHTYKLTIYFSNGLKCSYTICDSSLNTFENSFRLKEACMLRTIEDTIVGFPTSDIRIFFLSKLDEPIDFAKVFKEL